MEPMKVQPSFCADPGGDGDPTMPAFLALPAQMASPWIYHEPWESETATGSMGSDDDRVIIPGLVSSRSKVISMARAKVPPLW